MACSPELKPEFLVTIRVAVSKLHDLGQTPIGLRHFDMLGAVSFEGPRLRGEVRSGGMGAFLPFDCSD